MTTTKPKIEPSSKEQHASAEELRQVVDRLDEQLAAQAASGERKPETLAERAEAVKRYQAARNDADRPRQA